MNTLSSGLKVCAVLCVQADTGSAVRAIERIKNTGDQLFLEYAPDTKEAKQDKSALDSQFVVVATKLKTEGHYSGSAATLVYGDVSNQLALPVCSVELFHHNDQLYELESLAGCR